MITRNIHYNLKLANYFKEQILFFDDDLKKKPNIRKCMELPLQQTRGEQWDDVTDTLCNLDFIQAKAVAKKTYDLVQDLNDVLEVIPDNAGNIRQEKARQARMEKYTRDLIACANGKINRNELEIPESIVPWDLGRIYKELEIKINYSSRLDKLNSLLNFLGVEVEMLHKNAFEFPDYTIQQAWNYARSGYIHHESMDLLAKRKNRLLLLDNKCLPNWDPFPELIFSFETEQARATPNGKWGIGFKGNKVLLFNLFGKTKIAELSGHTNQVTGIAITPNGLFAVSSSWDRTIIQWDLHKRVPIKTLKGHYHHVKCVDITPNGKKAISGSSDCSVIIWNLESGKIIKTLEGHMGDVILIKISADGKRAISISLDQKAILWNLDSYEIIQKINKCLEYDNSLSITPNGKLAIISIDNGLFLWDLENGTLKRTPIPSTSSANISSDGRLVISGADIWDLNTFKILKSLKSPNAVDLDFLSDCKYAISKKGLWNLENGFTERDEESEIVVSDFKSRLLKNDHSCSQEAQEKIDSLKQNNEGFEKYFISTDERFVFTASADFLIKIFDLTNGQRIRTLKGHLNSVLVFNITPDGKILISGSKDETLILWNIFTGVPVKILHGHQSNIKIIRVSSDGKNALSGSDDGNIILWDLEKFELIRILRDDNSNLINLDFSSCGNLIYSSSTHSLNVWNITDGKKIAHFISPQSIQNSSFLHNSAILLLSNNKIKIVYLGQKLILPQLQNTTVSSKWNFKTNALDPHEIVCPYCRNPFKPDRDLLYEIECSVEQYNKNLPFLIIPQTVRENKKLYANCINCGKLIRCNPFFSFSYPLYHKHLTEIQDESFFIIIVWLNPAPENIIETTGGWLPVAINVPFINGTAVCVWRSEAKAIEYSEKEYVIFNNKIPSSIKTSFSVYRLTTNEVVQIARITFHNSVAIDPIYDGFTPSIAISDCFSFEKFMNMKNIK
jgi:WD40 repeat protein